MPGTSRLTAFVLLGGLVYLGTPSAARAQRVAPLPPAQPLGRALQAALGAPEAFTGTIDGVVRNEKGEPVAGVVVTAIGATTVFAVTDEQGHYELKALPPGPYLLRAHSSGYMAPRSRTVEVKASIKTASSFAIRRAEAGPTILAAGIGPVGNTAVAERPASEPHETTVNGHDGQPAATGEPGAANGSTTDDHSDTAWHLRHLRRGVLREVTIPGEFPAEFFEDEPEGTETIAVMLGRAVSSPARAATAFFADAPLSGQVNILTTNLFDAPNDLLSGGSVARGIAYVKVGAPVADGDWTVRGALTDGDLASWIVAGNFQTRPGARHARDIGMSYSMQRYGGGNPLALREMRDGARNAGSIYAFETFTISPAITVAYGGRYERYDYLDQRNLISPRAAVTLSPFDATRVTAAVSSRADAPGAQEFQPPSDEGIWLPPQRTFSSTGTGVGLRAERATEFRAGLERDLGPLTVIASAFGQHVENQMATLFGADLSNYPSANRGHYLVGTAGDVDARGGAVAVRADLGARFHGSVTYSNAVAKMTPTGDARYLLLLSPSTVRGQSERLQGITTTVETQVPETATRILVLYRVGNGFARPGDDRSRVDSRFDLQLRQSLPFLNFSSAQWEMLIAIRNSFREIDAEQSVYDELLAVQAPKRIIGGVALRF